MCRGSRTFCPTCVHVFGSMQPSLPIPSTRFAPGPPPLRRARWGLRRSRADLLRIVRHAVPPHRLQDGTIVGRLPDPLHDCVDADVRRGDGGRAGWQFFDNKRKAAPAPDWMVHGIPYRDKGRDQLSAVQPSCAPRRDTHGQRGRHSRADPFVTAAPSWLPL